MKGADNEGKGRESERVRGVRWMMKLYKGRKTQRNLEMKGEKLLGVCGVWW